MNERGFTLVEMLVALLLTGLVAVLAYTALSSTITANDATESDAARLQGLEQTFRVMQRDFSQVVRRPITNGYGESEAVFYGANDSAVLVSLTRAGWPDARGEQRSDLQRLLYRWQDNRLVREYWFNVDRAVLEDPVSTVLMEDIVDIRLRFLDGEGGDIDQQSTHWRDNWQAADASDRLPAAVEVTVTTEMWGEVRRLFPLPENG